MPPVRDYFAWFDAKVRGRPEAIFHNADLYPPHYRRVRAVTWVQTDKPVTTSTRLQPLRKRYPLEKYFLWAITETPLGTFRREHVIDPLLVYSRRAVHWRNYEAGYDAAELEPFDRAHATYVLQEYFVPVPRLMDFVPRLSEILQRYKVNAVNVSIRHAIADPGTLLAWARGETFAFVLYYKQGTDPHARTAVGVWTRALIDAVLACGGTYYLPYQLHATPAQFHNAYPAAREFFRLKQELDPGYRLRGALWDKYYRPTLATETAAPRSTSLLRRVYDNVREADCFYGFLQNIFNVLPEDRLHGLIATLASDVEDDETIYKLLQGRLHELTSPFTPLTHQLPALALQKKEMASQAAQLIAAPVQGYVEIGTCGQYVRALRAEVGAMSGPIHTVNERAPSMAPASIAERGQIKPIGTHHALDDYAPLPPAIADGSVSLVTCFIGLHHVAPDRLPAFLASIHRVLTTGGTFILRDHDVCSPGMHDRVALAHAVFNAVMGEPWASNAAERRHFASVASWIALVEAAGFRHTGKKLLQAGDPTAIPCLRLPG